MAALCQKNSRPAKLNLPEDVMLKAFDKFDPKFAEEYRKQKQSEQEGAVAGGWLIFFVALIAAVCCGLFIEDQVIAMSLLVGGVVIALWGLFRGLKKSNKNCDNNSSNSSNNNNKK